MFWLKKHMISIVVPVYKVEPYLHECVDSILCQTYKNIEILLIDDGSPDKCGDICDEYSRKDERIRVIHTANHGLSAARNIGIKEATGEFIGFVDSDDWIEPDMYEILLRKALETNADICECNFWFGTSTMNYSDFEDAIYRDEEPLIALFKNRICHVAWNKIYKRELFESVSFPEGRNIEDISIMHLLVEKAKIVAVISEKKYHYRQRADSIKYTYSARNLIDYADAFLDRYKFYNKNKGILYTVNEEDQLLSVASGISRVWRWWFGCNRVDRKKYSKKIYELKQFTKEHFSLFGCCSWPLFLRCSCLFMHSDHAISFIVLYYVNQLFRIIKPANLSILE